MQQLDAFKAPNVKSKAFLSTTLSPQARGSFFFFLDAGEIFPKRHNIRSFSTFPKRSNIIRFLPRSGLKERKHLNQASQDSQACFSSFFSATVHALSREHRVSFICTVWTFCQIWFCCSSISLRLPHSKTQEHTENFRAEVSLCCSGVRVCWRWRIYLKLKFQWELLIWPMGEAGYGAFTFVVTARFLGDSRSVRCGGGVQSGGGITQDKMRCLDGTLCSIRGHCGKNLCHSDLSTGYLQNVTKHKPWQNTNVNKQCSLLWQGDSAWVQPNDRSNSRAFITLHARNMSDWHCG